MKKSVPREYFESLVIAVVLALFVRTWVFQAFKIPTGSMEQNLLIGENSRLICIDPFTDYPGQEANFDHNVRAAGCAERIVKIRGRSQQLLPYLAAGSYDFIYVDGSHEVLDVLQDAAMCWRLVRPGGLLVFDDYEHSLFPNSFGMSAGPAIDTFLGLVKGQYELIFQDWQVAVRKNRRSHGIRPLGRPV